jgi:hypothetical protein
MLHYDYIKTMQGQKVCFLSYTKKEINRMKIYRSAKEGERERKVERERTGYNI